ncbi:rod shape-determining protein RodA [Erythrobacter arachoides]|uniref:Peptidoglycan glycosyltransferase MrdB n=1 Tax=Aurantiacibacter arachoides TaxID=1850444 RepID=A0A845A2R2_9SPHN|nr:rod shape-determining protein RodA [Aurantiacibacter arachoides]MXO93237.1 rod shape-determining protein RodA [Aurantiacibacter arachoides]GGD50891.1 rod shape-determining protein RodA [Aurantiacibacter arachoides]
MRGAITLPAPLAQFPWRVVIPLVLLVVFGAAVLHSAAGGSMSPYAWSHIIRFGVFLVMALIMSYVPLEWARIGAVPIYAATLLLLMAVEAVGAIGGGSQRWLELGFIRLQPSELMKPGIVLILAAFFHALPVGMIGTWRALLVPLGIMVVPVALVMLQPDLGTALAISFGAIVVMFMAGIPVKWFIGGGAAAIVTIPLAVMFVLKDYQRQRVLTFLDPESDPLGTGYHITQSKIAIGSGGIFGKGFGNGSQSHLDYLPEPHTDFVFATMSEEWGLVGGLFVLLIFGIVLRWGLLVARDAKDRFSRLLAGGLTATIFFYVAINLLMVMGFAPVVGIPLPFMSHGGSSMLTNMLCIGGLMMVDRHSRRMGSGSGF